jgi:hypothetical protein
VFRGIATVVLVLALLIAVGAQLVPDDKPKAKAATSQALHKAAANRSEPTTPAVEQSAPKPATPKERVREAIGSEVEAGGYAGTLEVGDVSFEGREVLVYLRTPEGGFQGASCGDLDDGARAVFKKIYGDAGWRKGAVLVYQGGLVSTRTGEELSDVNTGIFTMHARDASQIDWSNDDALNYNIAWSNYRDFCHPALKQ